MTDNEIIAEIKRIRGLFARNTPEASKDAFARFSRLLPFIGANERASKFVKEMTYLYRNRFVSDYVKESSVIVADAQKVGTEVLTGLSKVVQRGRSANLTDKEIEVELERVFSPQKVHWARTWNVTAQMALNRIGKFDNVEGDPLLKYVGASTTERSFCKLHLGKVKRKSEWEETLNDFGSSALYYGGGYYCRHRTEVVEEGIVQKPAATPRQEGLFHNDGMLSRLTVGRDVIQNPQRDYTVVDTLLKEVKSKTPFFSSLRESAERYRGLSPSQFNALVRELNKQGYDFAKLNDKLVDELVKKATPKPQISKTVMAVQNSQQVKNNIVTTVVFEGFTYTRTEPINPKNSYSMRWQNANGRTVDKSFAAQLENAFKKTR